MRIKGNINRQLPEGMERLFKPNNWITKLLWKFIHIKIELYVPPPTHINCRCLLVKGKQ